MMSNENLSLLLKQWRERMSTTEGRLGFAGEWERFLSEQHSLARAAGDAAVEFAARKAFRDLTRGEGSEQLHIAGFDVPARLYVQSDDGGVLVPAEIATRDEWRTFYDARRVNYEHARDSFYPLRDLHDAIDERWQQSPRLTFIEIMRVVFGSGAHADT